MGRDLASRWYSPSSLPAGKSRVGGFEHAWTGSGFGRSTMTMKLWPTAQGPFHQACVPYVGRAWRTPLSRSCSFAVYPEPKPIHYGQTGPSSHRISCVISSCCPQKEYLGSICTFRWARLDFVGSTLQHALHIKVLTFGGMFRDHSFFHNTDLERRRNVPQSTVGWAEGPFGMPSSPWTPGTYFPSTSTYLLCSTCPP